MIHLLNANALHIPLADNTVQCVITSPPYWGLRDYGTAEWIGGREDCNHVIGNSSVEYAATTSSTLSGGKGTQISAKYGQRAVGDQCPKCGAIRKDQQLGLEETPAEFIANMVAVFREVWRVLKDDGVIWVNMGDSYNANTGSGFNGQKRYDDANRNTKMPNSGLPPKNLVGIPWRLAFALQDDGWILRSDIIWAKPNPMPESVTDRPTKAHEYVFLLSKQGRYFYDADAIKVRTKPQSLKRIQQANFANQKGGPKDYRNGVNPNRSMRQTLENFAKDPNLANRRSVWTVATQPYSGAHFATFPPKLIEPMILAGSRPGDLVIDPFSGTATVGMVARKHHRRYVGLELNPEYIELAKERTRAIQPTLINMGAAI